MSALPQSVDEYISSFPPEVQAILQSVRASVRRAALEAVECISYRMPAIFQNGAVAYYAAFKAHIGLLPPVEDVRVKEKVACYVGPKGNLKFPYSEPVPYELIAAMVESRLSANLVKAKQAGSRKRSKQLKRPEAASRDA
jgi:uncharacterized protein YdhG (YjbR/CyaY superfamily)